LFSQVGKNSIVRGDLTVPIYEYQCLECDRRLETLQRLSEPRLTICPECGGELKKLFSAPAFQFKGEGWYVTDYARKGDDRKAGEEKPKEAKEGKDKDPAKPKEEKAKAAAGAASAKT
jgi:putative FmdB family regulatory protein